LSGDEWATLVVYLTLMREDNPQQEHSLQEKIKRLKYVVRTDWLSRMPPHDLPPWQDVYQQVRWRPHTGVFNDM